MQPTPRIDVSIFKAALLMPSESRDQALSYLCICKFSAYMFNHKILYSCGGKSPGSGSYFTLAQQSFTAQQVKCQIQSSHDVF